MNLIVFSKYRTQIMGIAAILILCCHANGNEVDLPYFLFRIFVFGNYGVELFLFLSGLGMYNSLKRTSNISIDWYKKRYARIFIPYMLIYIIYFILKGDYNFFNFILGASTLNFWLYHKGAWFIALLIPLYLITPQIGRYIDDYTNRIIPTIIIISIIILISSPSLKILCDSEIFVNNFQWAISRVPIFILGYYLAPFIMNETKIGIVEIIVYSVISIITMKVFGLTWLLVIPLLSILGYVLPFILRVKCVNTSLSCMGRISLESYLVNIFLGDLLRPINFPFSDNGNFIKYTVIVIGGLVFSLLINRVSERIIIKL